ncbi:NFACT family protein [Helicobacter sp. 11S03491-1]|uniref:NFACT family protein n=1 Tax=Helicobacter sp. 11S03491-1 TaxID=1476196 RepID=UPI000BA5BD78|nr:NFACT family protein [Helicobacter sp. 11S03491-1]PAF42008.1 hypothetical protein BKH45_05355 [Helicobacter sp. 11S03491-1]
MKLGLLKNIAKFFSTQEVIENLKRIDDNLFKLELKNKIFYFDMTKGESHIFITSTLLLPAKKYNAPFDVLLKKFCSRARILECKTDGDNRILKFDCKQSGAYKDILFSIQFEFTGRHTNVIILDSQNIVLEALRHINSDRSFREVRINKILQPLGQPHYRNFENHQDLNDEELLGQLEKFYLNMLEKKLALKKQILIENFSKKIQKLQKTLQDLPQEEEMVATADRLAKDANIVLANLGQIKNFVTTIKLKDFWGNEVEISLPSGIRTPQEGVNLMFSQAKKLIKKAKNTHMQVQNLESKIHFFNQEMRYIQTITSLQDLVILEPKKTDKKIYSKYEVIFIEGLKISIGRNKNENQALLEEARADDIWLHIRDIPSSHMIIHCGKGKVYEEIIYKAGQILVGLNSIQTGNFSVDYTRRKFVKIIEGSNVIYAKHQTFHYKK